MAYKGPHFAACIILQLRTNVLEIDSSTDTALFPLGDVPVQSGIRIVLEATLKGPFSAVSTKKPACLMNLLELEEICLFMEGERQTTSENLALKS